MLAAPALAVEFEPNDQGFTEFTMPSGNMGCIYVPAGGTDVYKTSDGGAELSCDRVEPSYVRVMLGSSGEAERITDVGDAFMLRGRQYIRVWRSMVGGSFQLHLRDDRTYCTRGTHGFSMSRKAVKVY